MRSFGAHRTPLACLILGLAAYLSSAQADVPYAPGGSTQLDLGRYRTEFSYADGEHLAHVGRYGIGYAEPIMDDVRLTLHGGYLTTDVDGEPVSAPLDFTGRYLGLGAEYEGSRGDHLNLAATLTYTWHDVDASGIGTQSNLTWYETWASFGPVLRWQRWRLSFGGYWQHLDGSETDSGAAARLDFSAGRDTGAYLGLLYYVDRTGSVGIYGTSGARKGIKLVFRREF
jgi:hypothetical protein